MQHLASAICGAIAICVVGASAAAHAQTVKWKTPENYQVRQLISHLPDNHEYMLCNESTGATVIVSYDHAPITPNSDRPPVSDPNGIGIEVPGVFNERVLGGNCVLIKGKRILISRNLPDANGQTQESAGTLELTLRQST
jgi:hypothetical protein